MRVPFAILLILAGAAAGLALPPVGWWWMWGLSLACLLWRFDAAKTGRGAALCGLLFGLGYFAFAFHWIGFAFLVDAEAYLWMMPFAVGGLAGFMACYWAAAALAAHLAPAALAPRSLRLILALATVEWLRGYLFTGFPWAAPGQAADGMGGVLQLASLAGMPGLTLFIFAWGALPYLAWRHWPSGWWSRAAAFGFALTLPAAFFWGEARLAAYPPTFDETAQVRLVQPNVPQDDKWRGENGGAMLATLLRLSTSGDGGKPQLIIWPEASVPFLLDEEPDALRLIGDALEPGQTLLAGSIRRIAGDPASEPYYTSILMIDDEGQVAGLYDKWRLVPGGEYLPLEWLLAPLGFRKVVSLPESLSAGRGPQNLRIPQIGLAGLLICYEAIFPHRLTASERPRLLVNVTNDGWFGRSVGPYQHLAQVRMRAVEQGIPVMRAANTGISAAIDSLGRIRKATQLGEEATLVSGLPPALPPTLYSVYGDFLFWSLTGLFLFVTATAQKPGRWRNMR
jgi:apolipoprotein N-acyltransferase